MPANGRWDLIRRLKDNVLTQSREKLHTMSTSLQIMSTRRVSQNRYLTIMATII